MWAVFYFLLGLIVGHWGSQWLSYKYFLFSIVNQNIIGWGEKVRHRAYRYVCCKKKPDPQPAPPDLMKMLEQMLMTSGHAKKHNHVTSTLPTVKQHSPTSRTHDSLKLNSPNENTNDDDSIASRQPLRKPSPHLL